MSDLRPIGVPIRFAGSDRRFLFNFEIIDELQSRHNGSSVFEIVEQAMENTVEGLTMIIDMVDVLCHGEIERKEIPRLLSVNTLTGEGTLQQVRKAVNLAVIESMPEPREDDISVEEGSGFIEINKFLVIATSKFGLSEKEAWALTPRKFGLLNDAYMTVNGLRAEETMSLSQLP